MPNAPVIERIELTAFEIELDSMVTDRAGFGISYQPGAKGTHVRFAVRIIADSGVVGEYVPPRGRARVLMTAAEALSFSLLGKPALQREKHYRSMRRLTKHIGEAGIGALDIALWDLAGKQHGCSVGQLLGGYRDRLPAYASTLGGDRLDGLSSPEAYADFAEQCLDMGYRGFKMHGWHEGDVGEETAMIKAVGERVGGRMDIMYDAACHPSTLADAIQIGRVCDAYGLYWLEDPYGDGGVSIHGHQMLKKNVRTPILVSEHVRNLETTTDMLVAGATDFARADPDYDGGITGCHKVAVAAEGLGMDCEVHSCGPAMRQLMSACRNANYYEVNLVHPKCGNAWSLPVYTDGYSDEIDCIDADGCVPVSADPGLGVRYDWDTIRKNAIETLIIE
ncbi:MAG: mandelate racemase/muconate lactonizing protein [Rhodospirillales bacterium]|nr:mandelate racemase/muconate lactonizing protein [Rhodospirillales bacterium]